jgi:membrane protease YdiL (CAAX protease family)
VLLVVFAALADGLTIALGRPVIPKFMIDAYSTAGFVPLLWTAVVLMAPLFEEVFFRGFIFQGIRHSRLGVCGAIVLTSLAWAGTHVQYDWYQMTIIFAGGILLGVARWRSKSVYPPLAMHAAMNLMATVEVAVYLR